MNAARSARIASPPDEAIVAVLRGTLPGVRTVYRYGSAGTGFERPDSDLDLAVLGDAPFDWTAMSRWRRNTIRVCCPITRI